MWPGEQVCGVMEESADGGSDRGGWRKTSAPMLEGEVSRTTVSDSASQFGLQRSAILLLFVNCLRLCFSLLPSLTPRLLRTLCLPSAALLWPPMEANHPLHITRASASTSRSTLNPARMPRHRSKPASSPCTLEKRASLLYAPHPAPFLFLR